MKPKPNASRKSTAKGPGLSGALTISPSTLREIKDGLFADAAAAARETAPLFKAMGWRYSANEGLRRAQRSGGRGGVPGEDDIRLTIRRLVSELSEVVVENRTGRFRVGYELDEMGGYHGFIVFEPERWQTETVT